MYASMVSITFGRKLDGTRRLWLDVQLVVTIRKLKIYPRNT